MLLKDNNQYIFKIYEKSVQLHRLGESGYFENQNNISQMDDNGGEEEEIDEDECWERQKIRLKTEAQAHCTQIYKEIKLYKASDIYIFEQNPIDSQQLLTHNEQYIPYPRKENLKHIIQQIMTYQEANNLIDYHPNMNDLSAGLKQIVDKEMKSTKRVFYGERDQVEKKKSTADIVKVRNIIHQSLSTYNKKYCKSNKQVQIDSYFERQFENYGLDQWGKDNKVSNSQFLWLPVEFIFSLDKNIYEIEGKLFNLLEECPYLQQLKNELNHLMTYFSQPLQKTHKYFSEISYRLMQNYSNYDLSEGIIDVKSKVDFSKRIHALVKITEMEIAPNSTYSGQWHVEGFSSDNILYTCLYVIEQDENLVDGKLKFKRTPHSGDVPVDPADQRQCAHQYCPNYEYLCDPIKVIPLGSLDIKENLMIIFPNQNIHQVKGIKNITDKPLKRKIIAFFIVNHIDQPFTINDIEFTEPIEVIKKNRLRDIYERSKNKQTDTQSFNYCEH